MSNHYEFHPIRLKFPEAKALLMEAENLPRPVMLWGPPGVGKTALVREVAKEKELPLRIFYAAYMEPPDIQGFPVPDKEEKVTRYYPPETLDLSADEGILFFDEITNARRDVQTVLLEIMREGSIVGRKLDGWLRVAAGNRVEDLAGSNAMISSLKDRLLHVELVADLDTSSRYWLQQGGDAAPFLVGFLHYRPKSFELLSPRAWTDAIHLLNKLGLDRGVEVVGGIIGEALQHDVRSFYAIRKELPFYGEIADDPEMATMPDVEGKPYVGYALVSYLSEVTRRGLKESVDEGRRRFATCIRYLERGQPFYVAAYIASVVQGFDSDQCKQLVNVPEYGRFVSEHANILI